MTNVEKKALLELLDGIENPAATTVEYDGKSRTEVNTHAEANRLLDSKDYKAGWKALAARVKHHVEWVIATGGVRATGRKKARGGR